MNIKQLDELLGEHAVFVGFDTDQLALIAGCSKNVVFEANDRILAEGTPADYFYVIRHGHVSVEISDPRRGTIRVETLGENEILGWSWLFPPYRVHFDASATTLVRAIAVDGACLRTKCEEDHTMGYLLMKRFASLILDRLQATRLQVLDLYA